MDILEEKENFLTNRKEVKFIVKAEKCLNYDEALGIIAEKFKVASELVVIKGVKGKFGRNTFLISAFIYKSKEDKEMYDKKKKGKAEQVQEQTQQSAQPAEQKKE